MLTGSYRVADIDDCKLIRGWGRRRWRLETRPSAQLTQTLAVSGCAIAIARTRARAVGIVDGQPACGSQPGTAEVSYCRNAQSIMAPAATSSSPPRSRPVRGAVQLQNGGVRLEVWIEPSASRYFTVATVFSARVLRVTPSTQPMPAATASGVTPRRVLISGQHRRATSSCSSRCRGTVRHAGMRSRRLRSPGGEHVRVSVLSMTRALDIGSIASR